MVQHCNPGCRCWRMLAKFCWVHKWKVQQQKALYSCSVCYHPWRHKEINLARNAWVAIIRVVFAIHFTFPSTSRSFSIYKCIYQILYVTQYTMSSNIWYRVSQLDKIQALSSLTSSSIVTSISCFPSCMKSWAFTCLLNDGIDHINSALRSSIHSGLKLNLFHFPWHEGGHTLYCTFLYRHHHSMPSASTSSILSYTGIYCDTKEDIDFHSV